MARIPRRRGLAWAPTLRQIGDVKSCEIRSGSSAVACIGCEREIANGCAEWSPAPPIHYRSGVTSFPAHQRQHQRWIRGLRGLRRVRYRSSRAATSTRHEQPGCWHRRHSPRGRRDVRRQGAASASGVVSNGGILDRMIRVAQTVCRSGRHRSSSPLSVILSALCRRVNATQS